MKNLSTVLFLLLPATCCFSQVFGAGQASPTSAFWRSGPNACIAPDAPVRVAIMKRNLDGGGYMARKLSEDAVHYHAVAFDSLGNVVGDFGWTGEGNVLKNTLVGSKGHVFSEPDSRFAVDYDQTPVAEATVSFKDWQLAQDQFRYNEARSGYRTVNNGIDDYHSPMGKGGKEYFNCQYAMSRFWTELGNTASFNATKPFEWPGGNAGSITFVKTVGEALTGEAIPTSMAVAGAAALATAGKMTPQSSSMAPVSSTLSTATPERMIKTAEQTCREQSALPGNSNLTAGRTDGDLSPEEAEILRVLTEYGPCYGGMILATQAEQGTGPLSAIEAREKQEKP